MIKWLCEAFGFEQQLVVTGDNGEVTLAQLKLGDNLVMITTDQDSPIDKLMAQPDEVGGVETQSCYVVVGDIDAHRAKAKAAGANILFDIDISFDTARASSGRGYVCRDLEGHIWSFGTYDPWRGQPPPVNGNGRVRAGVGRYSLWLGMAVAASLVIGSFIGRNVETFDVLSILPETDTAARPSSHSGEDELAAEHRARTAAERAAKDLQQELARERSARENAERAAGDAEARLAQSRKARSTGEQASSEALRQLEQERAARARAERAASEANEKLGREAAARQLAERSARDAQDLLLPERNARLAAEFAASELRNELRQKEGASPERYRSLREQLDAERNERAAAEQAVSVARRQLAQERSLREAAERALKQAEDKLSVAPPAPSCWLLPENTHGPCRQSQ
jgi:uncharacterized glyoxalase superfamily protein PhnB